MFGNVPPSASRFEMGPDRLRMGSPLGCSVTEDSDIGGSSSQDVIQIFELGTVVDHSVEAKFVRDLQRKKAKPIKAAAKVTATKRIKSAEGSRHLRTKRRYEHTPIRRYEIR